MKIFTKKLPQSLSIVIIAFVFSFFSIVPVKAFSDFYSDTENQFYDPNACDPTNGADTSSDISGDNNQQKAFNYFVSKGLTKEQSAGIVGNLMQESGETLDPAATNGSHWGIAQWDSGRWNNLKKFAKDHSLKYKELDAQLQFIWEELPSNGLSALKATTTAEDAASVFEANFERSGGSAVDVRQSNAKKVLKKYGGDSAEITPDEAPADTSEGDTGATCQCATSTISSAGGTSELPKKSQDVFDAAKKNIEKMKPIYEYGAEKVGIKWEYLAALHYREANNQPGTSILAGEQLGASNPDGVGSNTSDAKQNAVDAAKHFVEMAKMVYKVDPKKDMSNSDLKKAFLAYNRGHMYQTAHTSPDKSPYVMAGLDADHPIDMIFPNSSAEPGSTRGVHNQNLGAMAILAGLGVSGSGAESDCGGASLGCEDPGNADFVFPLCVTKKDIKEGVKYKGTTWVWCYTARTTCHHDYAAADIHAKVNTKVVAAVGGEVMQVHKATSCSSSSMDVPRLQIKAKDGLYYYYTHMKPGSIKVKDGQKVDAGDELGQVGPGECAQGTGPHLHIHRQSTPTTCAPCASQDPDRNSHDIQPALYQAFQSLPEN